MSTTNTKKNTSQSQFDRADLEKKLRELKDFQAQLQMAQHNQKHEINNVIFQTSISEMSTHLDVLNKHFQDMLNKPKAEWDAETVRSLKDTHSLYFDYMSLEEKQAKLLAYSKDAKNQADNNIGSTAMNVAKILLGVATLAGIITATAFFPPAGTALVPLITFFGKWIKDFMSQGQELKKNADTAEVAKSKLALVADTKTHSAEDIGNKAREIDIITTKLNTNKLTAPDESSSDHMTYPVAPKR